MIEASMLIPGIVLGIVFFVVGFVIWRVFKSR